MIWELDRAENVETTQTWKENFVILFYFSVCSWCSCIYDEPGFFFLLLKVWFGWLTWNYYTCVVVYYVMNGGYLGYVVRGLWILVFDWARRHWEIEFFISSMNGSRLMKIFSYRAAPACAIIFTILFQFVLLFTLGF